MGTLYILFNHFDTDAIDLVQFLYFILATTDFIGYENLLALGTLAGRTQGIDIVTNFQDKCAKSAILSDCLQQVISIFNYIYGNASVS